MTKSEFLTALRNRLSGLPQGDLERSLDFYSEMIDDRMEDGMTEAEAVANAGAVDDIAAQILKDSPAPESVPAPASAPESKKEEGHRRNPWVIAFTSPLWIILWILAIALAIVLWSVVVVFYVAAVGMGISGGVCHAAATVLLVAGKPAQGLLAWGIGVFLIGFTSLWSLGCRYLAMGVTMLCKQIFRGLRLIFVRKEELK